MTAQPIEKLAGEHELASQEQHDALYDLLVEAASEMPLVEVDAETAVETEREAA